MSYKINFKEGRGKIIFFAFLFVMGLVLMPASFALAATTVGNAVSVGSTLEVIGATTLTGALTANGAATLNGTVTLGDGGDAIAIDSSSWDISTGGRATNLSLVTSTLDSVVIGGSTKAAGSFTTLTSTGLFTPTGGISTTTLDGVVIGGSTKAAGSFTTLTSTGLFTPTGGISTTTLDGVVIGGSTAAAGSFAALSASGATTLNGAVTLGDAYADDIIITGRIASSLWASSTLYIGSAGGGEDLIVTNNAVTVGTSVNSSTLAVFGNTTLTGSMLSQTGHNNLYDLGAYGAAWRSIYVSTTAFLQDIDVNGVAYAWPSSQGAASTYLKNDGGGSLSWATAGGTNDWGRFGSAYGASALMTSSTYPVWFDGAVYASSTVRLGSGSGEIPTALFSTTDGNVRIATSTDMDANYSLIIGKKTAGFLGAILADGSIIPIPAFTGGPDLGSSVSSWGSGYFSVLLKVGSDSQNSQLNTVQLQIEDSILGATSTYANRTIKLGQSLGEWGILDNGKIYLNAQGASMGVYMRISDGLSATSTFSPDELKLGQTLTDSVMGTYNVGKFYVNATTGNVSASGTLQILGTATSTLKVDSSSGNKGACLKYQDIDGAGYTYCYYLNGVETCSQTSCE